MWVGVWTQFSQGHSNARVEIGNPAVGSGDLVWRVFLRLSASDLTLKAWFVGLRPLRGMVWGLTKVLPTAFSEVLSEENAREGPANEEQGGALVIHSLSLPPQGPNCQPEHQRFHGPVCNCVAGP